MADAIVKYFSEEKVIALIADLKKLKVNMTYSGQKQAEQDTVFTGKTIALTGEMEHFTRCKPKGKMKQRGVLVTGRASKKIKQCLPREPVESMDEKTME